ncbi:MAG: hypothetical protein WKF93_06535 [Acidimicrobiales bacterium]
MRRWTNPSLPQTLQIAVILLYVDAAFSVLFGTAFNLIGLIIVAGSVAGGFGIAQEKKWGYYLALAISVLGLLPVVLIALDQGILNLLLPINLLFAIFPVARFALLVHPQSRDYQKIWFT